MLINFYLIFEKLILEFGEMANNGSEECALDLHHLRTKRMYIQSVRLHSELSLIYLGLVDWRTMVQKSVHSTSIIREPKGCTSDRFVSD